MFYIFIQYKTKQDVCQLFTKYEWLYKNKNTPCENEYTDVRKDN